MQDDMADLLEDMNEIQEIMGRSYGYANPKESRYTHVSVD